MADSAVVNRGWRTVLAGTGINLALGVLYAWSVIKKAIPPEWGWDDADKALPYSVACIVFALVMVPAGRLQDRIGPRWVATAGGVLTGAGCILASLSTTVLWYVLGFGVLAGAGIGLGYAAATPPAVKWFPARRTGLVAGIVVAGFGLASVYISPLANLLTGFDLGGRPGPELRAALDARDAALPKAEGTPDDCAAAAATAAAGLLALEEGNLRRTLLLLGAGFLVVVTALGQFLVPPPPGWRPPDDGAAAAKGAPAGGSVDRGPSEILRTPLFWLLWVMFAFGAGAGLMIIGNITTIAKLGGVEAGFVLVALLAVGNAGGRIVSGMLSDRIGRLTTMCLVFLFQAALMMVLRAGVGNMALFVAVSMLVGFNYGSCLSVFPSTVKDDFGLRNFGVNYGLVFTAWGVGGLVLPLAAGRMFEAARRATGTGSYDGAYLAAAGLLVVAAALTFATRAVERAFRAGTSSPAPAPRAAVGRG